MTSPGTESSSTSIKGKWAAQTPKLAENEMVVYEFTAE